VFIISFEGRIDYIFLFTRLDLDCIISYDEATQRIVATSSFDPDANAGVGIDDSTNARRAGHEGHAMPSSAVVEFYVPHVSECHVMKYQKGEELSDHFAVTAEFVMK
jgi:hypothetical protein